MKRIYLMRHGQSEANLKGVYAGQLDSPLTDLGRQEAAQAVAAIQPLQLDLIIASDLSRAAETAAIVARGLSQPLPFELDARLREVDIGELSASRDEGFRIYLEATESEPPLYNVEPLDQLTDRAVAALRDAYERTEANILLVSHAGTARILHAWTENVAIMERMTLMTDNCEVALLPLDRLGEATV